MWLTPVVGTMQSNSLPFLGASSSIAIDQGNSLDGKTAPRFTALQKLNWMSAQRKQWRSAKTLSKTNDAFVTDFPNALTNEATYAPSTFFSPTSAMPFSNTPTVAMPSPSSSSLWQQSRSLQQEKEPKEEPTRVNTNPRLRQKKNHAPTVEKRS